MSRMFYIDGKPMVTWNIFVGCEFECSYCNARKAALTRFKHIPRYKDGFRPHLVEGELKRTFKPNQFIFVAYMGDISFATPYEVNLILNRITQFPETKFLLCTKNPSYYHHWQLSLPHNIYLGTTIETNRQHFISKAPTPLNRYRDLEAYPHPHKFLSIEPIMDFDLEELTHWAKLLQPDIIEIGADNYHNHLPEPSPEKLEQLLVNLKTICPKVIEKEGLERLKEGIDGN